MSPRAKLDVYGDIMSDGSNMWMFHTPDDGRKSLYFGRGSNGNVAEWPIEFKAGGGASFAGNVYANDYWIGAAGKWASQVSLQCVQKTLAGSGPDKNIYCDSGYTVTGGGCDVREGGDRSEHWWSKPLSNGWSCHANGGVYNVYVICCK